MRRRARLTARMPQWNRRRWGIAALALAAALALSGAAVATASGGTAANAPHAASSTPSPTPHPTQKPRPPTVTVYASQGGIVSPDSTVDFTVSVDNTSASPISSGTVAINLTERALDSRAELASWLAGTSQVPARTVQTAPSAPVPVGTSTVVAVVSVSAASLGVTGASTADFGVSAALTADGGQVAAGFSSIVWNGAPATHRTPVAIAMPVTVPPSTSGLIPAATLASYTAPDGVLTRQLDVARAAPTVTLGIDPMIIASINVLGSSAPASAHEWLQQLSLLPNETFALQYGDADVAGQLQAGLNALWEPISFNYAINPGNFASKLTIGETPGAAPTSPATTTGTPSPAPTGNPNVPTLGQVLSWPYTLHGIVWPVEGSMTAQTATRLVKFGYPTSILSGANTNAATLKTTPGAALPIQGGTALASDSTLSSELRAAVYATTDDQRGSALAQFNSTLALTNAESAPQGRVILATLDRDWPSNWQRAAQTLSAVSASPWLEPATLAQAIASSPTAGLAIKDSPESGSRLALVRQLEGNGDQSATGAQLVPSGEAGIAQFATALADPSQLTGPTRNGIMAVMGVGWTRPHNEWTAAVSKTIIQMQKTVGSVQIVPTGNITVASAQSQIPITVTNEFDLPVTVMLTASPSNGRIEVDATDAKQIPARASGKVLVPVKARLGNGKVTLHMQLFTPPDAAGAQFRVGAGQTASIEVHAEWEGIGAFIIGAFAVLLFGFGVVRAILRRRKASRGGDTDDAETADGEADPAESTDTEADAPDTTVPAGAADAGADPPDEDAHG